MKRIDGEKTGQRTGGGAPSSVPDPEVPEKARRRTYTAEYKLRILEEADVCRESGEIGALLRREGLYYSALSIWRRQREGGSLSALSGKKRGRKAATRNPLSRRLAELEQENHKLKARLQQAETIIDFQKKVSEVLGIPLKNDESDS